MELIHQCMLCGQKTDILPSEASMLCELCGMSMESRSPYYVIVGKSSYHNFCGSRCVKMYQASSGLASQLKRGGVID